MSMAEIFCVYWNLTIYFIYQIFRLKWIAIRRIWLLRLYVNLVFRRIHNEMVIYHFRLYWCLEMFNLAYNVWFNVSHTAVDAIILPKTLTSIIFFSSLVVVSSLSQLNKSYGIWFKWREFHNVLSQPNDSHSHSHSHLKTTKLKAKRTGDC